MKDAMYVELLKQGKEVWNRWREQHLGVHPDLSGEDLRAMNLAEMDLSFVKLNEAQLAQGKLHGQN
jgi:uncharacterized protein YjbI with pentapeptide repeats